MRAEQRTVVGGDAVGDMAITYSKRADGTWLIRSKGTVRGEAMHFGRVCTADGQKCVRWDADGAQARPQGRPRRRVQAQGARLATRRRRDHRAMPAIAAGVGMERRGGVAGHQRLDPAQCRATCTRRGRCSPCSRRRASRRWPPPACASIALSSLLLRAQVRHVGPRERHLRPAADAGLGQDRRVVDDEDRAPRRRVVDALDHAPRPSARSSAIRVADLVDAVADVAVLARRAERVGGRAVLEDLGEADVVAADLQRHDPRSPR